MKEFARCNICSLKDAETCPPYFVKGLFCGVMLLGEAPGRKEIEDQEVFVGSSGGYLEQAIWQAEAKKSWFYISNTVLCRPTKHEGMSNRTPTKDEIMCCNTRLHNEVKTINPKVIVTLGRTAYFGLMGEWIKVTEMEDILVNYGGRIVIPTIHPASCIYSSGGHEGVEKIEKSIRRALREVR